MVNNTVGNTPKDKSRMGGELQNMSHQNKSKGNLVDNNMAQQNSKSVKSFSAIHQRPDDASERKNQSVLNLQRKKKMAENDAQLLANRIAMLESEQNRLMKKIDNTRKRAD